MTQEWPYGGWTSPILASMLAGKTSVPSDVRLTDDNTLYWLESRPHQGGRYVIMRQNPGESEPQEMTPAGFNVRSGVHEYGGAPYAVGENTLYFSNYVDHRFYAQGPSSDVTPITPQESRMRYADPVWDPAHRRLLAVREDHTESDIGAVTTIVSLDPTHPGPGQVLVEGWDFFSSPRLSPDGTRLAWLCWDHPNMPWDGTELWVGEVSGDGTLTNSMRLAGGLAESIFQPSWSPDGTLYYVSDRTGWWNLYRIRHGFTEAVTARQVEFGQPGWAFGQSTYGFWGTQIIACYSDNDYEHLTVVDSESLAMREVPSPYTAFSYVVANQHGAAFVVGAPDRPTALVRWEPSTAFVAVKAETAPISADDISIPQAIEFPTENAQTAHMWYYPPKNQAFRGPADEKPPLVVFNHGGPTSQSNGTFRLAIQYWTTRGFAVADVNYRGSTGYGRAYRRLLTQSWGIVDVEDCCNAALYLANQGLVDGSRMAIRGGSAGGYTTLACLTFRDVFAAGASYYGVSDLGLLARETHKFESRYMDSMVGPWPETRARYEARSPLMHIEQISVPLILFQGLDDKVVLPNQAELVVEKLTSRGVPVAYLPFEGEGHGFRRAENIIRSNEAELYFYSEVFGVPLSEEIEPVPIANWPAQS